MKETPRIRVSQVNKAPVRRDGDFVLYWMTANRRRQWNFSLQRAAWWAGELNKPLVVVEALRVGYRWACDRFHRFIMEGMADNAQSFRNSGALYYPYVEMKKDEGKGLLRALGESACVVVTDNFPSYFLPRMIDAAGRQVSSCLERVDSNGLAPLDSADKAFTTAYSFRRHLQKILPLYLNGFPEPDPLTGFDLPVIQNLPDPITRQWPPATREILRADSAALARFPIDHKVGPATMKGGAKEARETLDLFIGACLRRYEERNHPDAEVTSNLSPYLHFGHISSHQVFSAVMEVERWTPDKFSVKADGRRQGWWGVGEAAESFLDQLITWRELGYNMCRFRDDYDAYESLPDWARKTLEEHAIDRREYRYSPEEFENGRTHDFLWNAAQNQLRREGRLHNYLRMLWGKKILEWTGSPREASRVMIELNNKYSLDGRDPNSYSGIFWVLGRYDRAWQERSIFGKVRYMSSESAMRKLRLKKYLERYAS